MSYQSRVVGSIFVETQNNENEKIQVAGIITETDLKSLELGMEMETTTLSMFTNEEKQDVVTWAFRAAK